MFLAIAEPFIFMPAMTLTNIYTGSYNLKNVNAVFKLSLLIMFCPMVEVTLPYGGSTDTQNLIGAF